MPITQAQCQQLHALLSFHTSLNVTSPPQTPPSTSSQSEASSSILHQVATASSQFLSGIFHSSLQQNTPITTRVITTKMIIVVIHVLLHQFIRFRCKSYLKTSNLLLQK
jgi:hypothetical protein